MILIKNVSSKGATASSLVVDKPSGAIKAGDLLFAHITADNHTANRKTITTIPSGWAVIADSTGYKDNSQAVLYKIATSSEPSSYAFTFSSSEEYAVHTVHVTTD